MEKPSCISLKITPSLLARAKRGSLTMRTWRSLGNKALTLKETSLKLVAPGFSCFFHSQASPESGSSNSPTLPFKSFYHFMNPEQLQTSRPLL